MFKNLLLSLIFFWNMAGVLAASPKTILVIGDSLSAAYGMATEQGWVSLLAQRVQSHGYQVVNASISGDTTSGGHSRLPQALQKFKPTLVILELGANDGLRGLPIKEMRYHLASMIEISRQAGAQVLLLGMRIPSNYGKAYAEQFQQVYHDLAKKYQLSLVPFWLAKVADRREFIQEDNLHPTATAQPQLLENIWEKLEGMLVK